MQVVKRVTLQRLMPDAASTFAQLFTRLEIQEPCFTDLVVLYRKSKSVLERPSSEKDQLPRYSKVSHCSQSCPPKHAVALTFGRVLTSIAQRWISCPAMILQYRSFAAGQLFAPAYANPAYVSESVKLSYMQSRLFQLLAELLLSTPGKAQNYTEVLLQMAQVQ